MHKDLENQLRLLALEKAEELERFKQTVQQLPLAERKETGVTWYPLQIVKSGYTYGERAFVIAERTTELGNAHRFRAGTIVSLYTNRAGEKTKDFSGVVNYVKKDRIKIILNSKDLPDWLNDGNIGTDLLFDDRTFVETEKALKAVINAKGDRLAELREVLKGKAEPRFHYSPQPPAFPALNDSQTRAVHHILAALDAAVIHGPPGTGKTTTLVQAIKALTDTEATVLVCAPSNSATDLLTLRCAEAGLNAVRIGNISRVDEDIIRHTLEMKLAAHPESKNIKKVKVQAAEVRKKARKHKRRFGRAEALQRRDGLREARALETWANNLEERLIDRLLSGAQVITCTLVGASHRVLDKRRFKTVVIDEAAQALEPATWIPILKASKVVLAGDPFQLPPTVKSEEAKRGGLGVTLLEKLLQKFSDTALLTTQYRMHEAIMEFSNRRFYGGQLHADASVAGHSLDIGVHPAVVFIDTAGCGFEEKINERTQSRFNPEEFQIICEHLYQLIDKFEERPVPPVAVISPYREQVLYIKQAAEEDEKLRNISWDVKSIDGFQGQEREIVYISLVRSNGTGEIGFLKDYRRMNVAMTRAKKMLVVVGDSATVGRHQFYEDFINYTEKHGQYQTAWEYMQLS